MARQQSKPKVKIVHVGKGRFEFDIEGELLTLRYGEVLQARSNMEGRIEPHCVRKHQLMSTIIDALPAPVSQDDDPSDRCEELLEFAAATKGVDVHDVATDDPYALWAAIFHEHRQISGPPHQTITAPPQTQQSDATSMVQQEIARKAMLVDLRKRGFESIEEFERLLGRVDTSTPDLQAALEAWSDEEGTKEQLLELPQFQEGTAA